MSVGEVIIGSKQNTKEILKEKKIEENCKE
jgi:hypothetical protein